MFLVLIIVTFCLCVDALAELEGYVVGGDRSDIHKLPHLACLIVICDGQYICGANILNEKVLLTAAHCMDGCRKDNYTIIAKFGVTNIRQGKARKAMNYMINHHYDHHSLKSDIAIVLVRGRFQFGISVRRAAIMRTPPSAQYAMTGGWGLVNEFTQLAQDDLKRVKQRLWSRKQCLEILLQLPDGVICGGEIESNQYVSAGDSGGGLIVKKYILIGLVSYKDPAISRSLVVYTDVAYYYNWITNHVKEILRTC